jgi:hypothetical protein
MSRVWDKDELKLLNSNWGKISQDDLMKLFPDRSNNAIYNKAMDQKLPKINWKFVGRRAIKDRHRDKLKELGITRSPKLTRFAHSDDVYIERWVDYTARKKAERRAAREATKCQ